MTQPAKVLIVDDERMIRLNLRALLEDLGYRVVDAADGREGLDAFAREQPDLVLADLRMPGMDGLGMISRLRGISPETPVIVISGAGTVGDAVDSLRLGVWDYIMKPAADAEGLAIIIERALEKARLLRENRRYREHLEVLVRERTEELSKSEARYRRIVDTANEGVWVLGPDMETASVNARMTEMLGFTSEEMAGRPFTDFIFEEDIPHHLRQIEDLRRGMKGHYECRFRHRDGREVWTLASAGSLFDEQGRFEGSFAMFADITERKRSVELMHRREEEFRAVVENSPDIIARYDAEGRRIYVNPAMQRLFGLPEKDIIGKTPLDFSPLPEAADFMRMVREVMEKGNESHMDVSVRPRQGEIRRFDVRVVPEFGPVGKVASCLAIGRDVTDERKMEKELFRAKKMEIIGRLAGGVAHEVRNPLNAILSISEALFREKEIEGNPEFLPYIRHMRTQVERLSKLMRDLLDLGKPISSANIQPVLLNDVLTEVISLWSMTGATGTHPVAAACPDTAGWLVDADSTRLQQALLNLMENSAQHSPAGSEICLRICAAADQWVSIQVTDRGKGIPPDKLDYVFEPFFTTRAGGTGLGLALVKHYVESMGGSVRIINNKPPPGCTAEVTLRMAGEIGMVDNETENTAD